MSETNQSSTIILTFDFSRTWKTLRDRSIKASIFYRIIKIGGFRDYDQLQAQYPVTIAIDHVNNEVKIQFTSLQALGISDTPDSCPADLTKSLREKAVLLATLKPKQIQSVLTARS